MGISYVDEINISGKKVFLRVDFNVPTDERGNILDDRRIRSVLPTINYLLDMECSIVLASHMGRPKGKRVERFSLHPVSKRLSRLLDKPVKFVDDCIGEEVKKQVQSLGKGELLLLENLRFHEGETKDAPEFAKELASLAEIYVNDAFAVSHRKNASVHAIVDCFDVCGAGFLVKKELDVLRRLLENPGRPFVAVVGGAKVSDKVGAVRNLMHKVDKILIGGAMAFTFLEALGYTTGKSLVENELIESADKILNEAKEYGVKIYLPVDCVVAESPEAGAIPLVVTAQEIPENYMGLDIGPATITLFSEALRDASTIVWNGPMGVFEVERFSKGTYAMVSCLANSTAFTVVGGGDTDVAVYNAGEIHRISYISTGGGAFLEVLEGKELPGIEALKK